MARFAHPDFDALQQAVCDAARGVFLNARAKRPNETFIAYVLTSYGSGALGGCCINTAENHERVWRQALTHGYTKPEDEAFYKWGVVDWGEGEYVDDHQDVFDGPWARYDRAMKTYGALLADSGRDADEIYAWSEDHPLHHALASALEQLDSEGVFGTGEARGNALVFMMQYDGHHEIAPWSIARLNPTVSESLKQEARSAWTAPAMI